MGKNKGYLSVKLDNGKVVTVKSENKGDSYSVHGGHNYESIGNIKSCKSLNEDTPAPAKFMETKNTKG